MTYLNTFVAVIKVGGKILREHGDVVTIPFGEEYSILLKNLNSVNAVVNVSIDGSDVLNGNQIIVRPNSSVELEGFMKGIGVSNKFKFIQKTKQIQDYRGDKPDDGIVRVEYRFEKKDFRTICQEPTWNYNTWTSQPIAPKWDNTGLFNLNNVTVSYSAQIENVVSQSNRSVSSNFCVQDMLMEDEGITVKGSKSDQKFYPSWTKELEDASYVIILRLRGINSKGIPIKEPIKVDKKITCETCGIKSRSAAKFCRNCGTSLI